MPTLLPRSFIATLLSHSPIVTLSSCYPIPVLKFCPLVAILSTCFLVPALLSYHLVAALASHSLLLTWLSYSFMPDALLSPLVLALLSRPILTLLSSFMPSSSSRSVLGPASTHLISLAFRTFKRALSDEFLHSRSTRFSATKSLCLFPTFKPLSKKNDYKQLFDSAFIYSRLLAKNHTAEEMDLSFWKCGYPALVKLNRS